CCRACLDGMSSTVLPLTADRFEDLGTVINPRGNPRHCWCLAYRLTSAQVRELAEDATGGREAHMRPLAERDPAPGPPAYPVDELPAWSVFCLVVRTGFRRQGVTGQLLAGVEEYAGAHGAPALEAYPVEPVPGTRVNSAFAYVGTTGMFEHAGYVRVRETSST